MDEELVNKKVKSEKLENFIFDAIAIICIVIIAIGVSPKILQNDTFYNIKCGEYIFKHGIFGISQDPFSWQGLTYTWPHWLYDLCIISGYNVICFIFIKAIYCC